jgi:FkbM family methyltransferase
VARVVGIDVQRYRPTPPPGSSRRGVGDIQKFLEDVRARGFVPRGIIDVGANRGEWTRMALSVFPNAEVIMIEPQAEMMPLLEGLCAETPAISLIKGGVGSEPRELFQTIWDDLAGSSFLPPEDAVLQAKGKQRLTPITTIDTILSEHQHFHPDLVKLDIQGFELEALLGASSIFGVTEMFIIEVSLFEFMAGQPVAREVIAFMANRGYELYDVPGFCRRPSDGALGQLDLAFTKSGGFLRASSSW